MSVQAVLLPVFVLVFATFIVMFWNAGHRVSRITRRELRMKDFALGPVNVPPETARLGNTFNNMLQVPLLFYVLVAIALPLRQADLLFVLLSWVFVVLRILHALVYIGYNNVAHRFYAFAASATVLFAMWVAFALKILLAP